MKITKQEIALSVHESFEQDTGHPMFYAQSDDDQPYNIQGTFYGLELLNTAPAKVEPGVQKPIPLIMICAKVIQESALDHTFYVPHRELVRSDL
jgi:hypothetical protein